MEERFKAVKTAATDSSGVAEMVAKINYTDEQVARISEVTAAGAVGLDVAEKLAAEFGKGVKSVVAKLSRMGLYKAKVHTRKDGSAVHKKEAFADAIGRILNLSEPDTESLTKANRKALETIFAALANSKLVD